MPSLIIFDVGHGSCAFLQDGAVRTLFDCKDASLLVEFLLAHNIDKIDQVVISHTDADHIAGIAALIQSDYVQIGSVYVNADAAKDTDVWSELKIALQDAADKKGLEVMTTIGANMPNSLDHDAVRIEVVAPGILWRLTGNGGRLPNGDSLNANSMSVVLRLHHDNHPVVLLPGDMDMPALQEIVARNQQLTADILVFPHHGGYVSAAGNAAARQAENIAFTTDLLSRCAPRMVVFSIGRGIHATPRPEIIQQIHDGPQPCVISCTQLSEHCHAGATPANPIHLGPLPARGRPGNRCCGGSMEIQLAGNGTVAAIVRQLHTDFITNHVTTPLCLPPAVP
ncbi:MAG: MBL fold metallo-hydrolase [Verrucomicrobia bacterium]|nr:MBL fold metallo-hydrolase [Verrucomicrobiota bacterium]